MYKIIKFYKLNNLSYNMIFKNTNNEYISRNIYNKLLNSNNISVKPKYQVIDTMYKCIYFILNNTSIILIEIPSAIIPSLTSRRINLAQVSSTIPLIAIKSPNDDNGSQFRALINARLVADWSNSFDSLCKSYSIFS